MEEKAWALRLRIVPDYSRSPCCNASVAIMPDFDDPAPDARMRQCPACLKRLSSVSKPYRAAPLPVPDLRRADIDG